MNDSPRKASYVAGLSFGWLLLLSHRADGEVAAGSDAPAHALAHIDRGLLALLRIPKLSDESAVTRSFPLFALLHLPSDECGRVGGGELAIRVQVCGDQEDFATDLADEICAHLLPPSASRPARLLHLLSYLELAPLGQASEMGSLAADFLANLGPGGADIEGAEAALSKRALKKQRKEQIEAAAAVELQPIVS
ncbi:MAG: hypothetical protein SGPRY_011460, partial [Prymnesium sp.]